MADRRKTNQAAKAAEKAENAGFSLIELLIGISVLAVVGFMTMSLIGTASRLYQSSIRTSRIQSESQTVSRRISRAVMDAESIYLDGGSQGTILFTGEITNNTDDVLYSGQMFWWDKENGRLYEGSHVSILRPKEEQPDQPSGALTPESASDFFTGGTGDGREYLVSDKLSNMTIELYPGLMEENRSPGGGYYYQADGAVTVEYSLSFAYMDSGEYQIQSAATTRNTVSNLWERKTE